MKREWSFPAVHVLVVDIHDFLAEAFNEELRNTRLPRPRRAVEKSWISAFPMGDGVEDTGEVVDLGIPVLHLPRDELRLQHARIRNHTRLTRTGAY